MGVTFIAPQGTYTAPAKLVSKSITENGTYDPADDNANGYSSVTVNVEGGGGSSDFSTAKVTLTNETPLGLTLAHSDNTTGISPQMGQSGEYEVVLYKGKAEGIFMSPSGNVSVTGNITYNDGELVITGDGTITISE